MAEIGNIITKKNFVRYLKSLGIEMHLNTKARGHSGFCTGKRIDIAKDLPDEKALEVLFHEFGHYVHFKLEPDIARTHGKLEVLFQTNEVQQIENELFEITPLVFDNSLLHKISEIKDGITKKIKTQREIIKSSYPEFCVSKGFREFERFIRRSTAKYLLKYDKVLIKGGWFSKDNTISIETIEKDFPTMPEEFRAYIKMRSFERQRNRLTARASKIKNYLKRPSELFARFFQMYYTDIETAKNIAPITFERFEKLKNEGYYPYLNDKFFQE